MGVLLMVAIMGAVAAATGQIWHTAHQREREEELLLIGDQFRRALDQFAKHTPGQGRRQPLSLDELLRDPRHPGIQRYLRKVYRDPITGRAEWGLVTGPNGEIYGVHSLSSDEPLKKSNFGLADRNFEGKMKHSDWVFMQATR